MRRRRLALGLVIAFVALAGCSSMFGPGAGGGDDAHNASYEWNDSVNASINVTGGSYGAVYDVPNQTTFPVFERNELGQNEPLRVSGLRFRYPNGTVVTQRESPGFNVTTQQKRTVIALPARNGTLAFTASTQGKRFATRTFVEGSYAVTIPKGMRVEYVPLAKVAPSGYRTERTADGRVRITWENVQSSAVVVRYYLARDLYIFAVGAAVLVVVAAGGALYYRRRIRELERRRQEAGPDVDTSSTDDGPPGFG